MEQEKDGQSKLYNCLLYGFAVIGVLSTLGIIVLAGLGYSAWQNNFLGVQDFFENGMQVPTSTFKAPTVEDGKLQLTPTQEQMLRTAGIDPEELQQKDIQELNNCAEKQLGSRYQKIMSGETSPTYSDFQKLKPCAE